MGFLLYSVLNPLHWKYFVYLGSTQCSLFQKAALFLPTLTVLCAIYSLKPRKSIGLTTNLFYDELYTIEKHIVARLSCRKIRCLTGIVELLAFVCQFCHVQSTVTLKKKYIVSMAKSILRNPKIEK